jgi:hypothetical protein
MGAAGNVILFVFTMVGTTIVACYVLTYAAYCVLLVVQDTAAGVDRVGWGGEPMADWMPRSVLVIGIALIWVAPAGILARALRHDWLPNDPGLRLLLLAVPGLWLFFPVGLLSALTSTAIWTPFRPAVVVKMLRVFPATAWFYGVSAVLMLAAAALWYVSLFAAGVYLLPVAAAAGAAVLLIYARLLGRVGWLIRRLKPAKAAPEHQPARKAERKPARERPKSGGKAGRKPAAQGHDPWAVPDAPEPEAGAQARPVEGYGVASEESAAAAAEPEEPKPRKKKKAYEPPHPLEIERYELSAAGGADAPGEPPPVLTPLDGYDPVGLDPLPPEERSATADAERLGSAVSDFEKRLLQPRKPEPVPALPLVSGVFSFPFYESSLGALAALAVGGLALGICVRGMLAFWPFG